MIQYYCLKHKTRLVLKDGFRGFPDFYACPKCNFKIPLVEINKIEKNIKKGRTRFSTYYTNVFVEGEKAYLERRLPR